jgi:hypothetical protein
MYIYIYTYVYIYIGHNPMEHIHGPSCDCNPESALRVQYLRLVHNFYDRDFLGNSCIYKYIYIYMYINIYNA